MADKWATGGSGGPHSRDGRAGLSCVEQRRGRHGGEEGSVLWGRGVSERGKREERCGLSALRDAGRSGAGRGAGLGSGERTGPGGGTAGWAGSGWTRERLGRAGLGFGLGCFGFGFLFYFYSKQSLNSKQNLNSNHTQIIKTIHQHECNTKI